MLSKLAALINVKTIVTFVVTLVFAVLSLRGDIKPDSVLQIFGVIIAFFFGMQIQKKADSER